MEHFRMLGIKPGASQKEIKAAYRKLAMKFHPDRSGGSKEAEVRFKEISNAYKALTSRTSTRNPEKRQDGKASHKDAADRSDHYARQGATKVSPDYAGTLHSLRAVNRRFDDFDAEVQKTKDSFARFDEIMKSAGGEKRAAENRAQNNAAKEHIAAGNSSQKIVENAAKMREMVNEKIENLYRNLSEANSILDRHQTKSASIHSNSKTLLAAA